VRTSRRPLNLPAGFTDPSPQRISKKTLSLCGLCESQSCLSHRAHRDTEINEYLPDFLRGRNQAKLSSACMALKSEHFGFNSWRTLMTRNLPSGWGPFSDPSLPSQRIGKKEYSVPLWPLWEIIKNHPLGRFNLPFGGWSPGAADGKAKNQGAIPIISAGFTDPSFSQRISKKTQRLSASARAKAVYLTEPI